MRYPRTTKSPRPRKFEQLERRDLLAAIPFGTNPLQPLDVNRDGTVTALDALTIINSLQDGEPSRQVGNFLDVNGRDGATSLDALEVINALGRNRPVIAATLPTDSAPSDRKEWAADLRTNAYDINLNVSVGDRGESPVRMRIGGSGGSFADITDLFDGNSVALTEQQVDSVFGGAPLPDGNHQVEVQLGDNDGNIVFELTVDRERPRLRIRSGSEFSNSPKILPVDFGERVDPDTVSPAEISISRGGSSIDMTPTRNGNGSLTLNFSEELEPGVYEVTYSGSARDLAGNIGEESVASFTVSESKTVSDQFHSRLFVTQSITSVVKSADLNGDEIPDLIAVAGAGDDVAVLIGRGNGTFYTAVLYPTGDEPQRNDFQEPVDIEIVDVNGDDYFDLITANNSANTVSIFIGNGDGSFQDTRDHPSTFEPSDVTSGDLNNDGYVDLVVANGAGGGQVLMNRGDGTFSGGEVSDGFFGGGNNPGSPLWPVARTRVHLVDVTGDGSLDLIADWLGGSDTEVLVGSGDGTFQPPQAESFTSSTLNQSTVIDLNGDDLVDIVFPALGNANVAFGNADGAFSASTAFAPGFDTFNPIVSTADFNADGLMDLLSTGDSEFSVRMSNGDGTFGEPRVSIVTNFIVSTEAVDVDQDGDADLILSTSVFDGSATGDSIMVLLNQGDGVFFQPQAIPFYSPLASTSTSLHVVDVNNDGVLDFVSGNTVEGVSVALSYSGGRLRLPEQISAVEASAFQTADLDKNGAIDIVIADSRNSEVVILFGKGDGSFDDAISESIVTRPDAIELQDLNADSFLDVIVAAGQQFSVLLNNGNGTFRGVGLFGTADGFNDRTESIAVADVNGDNRPDFIALSGNHIAGSISQYFGNSDGSFSARISFDVPASSEMLVADIDGDGPLDLVLAYESSDILSLLLGNSDGTFEDPVSVGPWNRQHTLGKPMDVDQDGDVDLISYGQRSVTVMFNQKADFSDDVHSYAVPDRTSTAQVVDADQDGDLDIVSLARDIHVIENNSIKGTPFSLFGLNELEGLEDNERSSFIAKLDADDLPDLITTPDDRAIVVRSGTPGNLFAADARAVFTTEGSIGLVASGDVNGDGIDDILFTLQEDIFDDDVLTVLIANEDGSFGSPIEVVNDGRGFRTLFLHDFDSDGILDIIAGAESDEIVLYHGNGSGAFQEHAVVDGKNTFGRNFYFADLNNDGFSDLFLKTEFQGQAQTVIITNSTGSFDEPMEFPYTVNATLVDGLVFADVNDDGFVDLIENSFASVGSATLYLGNGDGTFQSPRTFLNDDRATVHQVVDVNGDGTVDVVAFVGGRTAFEFAVYVGTGAGNYEFEYRIEHPVRFEPTRTIIADINGDGRLDLLSNQHYLLTLS